MGDSRTTKRIALAIGLSMIVLIVVVGAVAFSGGKRRIASAAPAMGGFNLPTLQGGAKVDAAPGVAHGPKLPIHIYAAKGATIPVAVGEVDPVELLYASLQPRLVQSHSALNTGYVTTAFLAPADLSSADHDSNLGPVILLGSVTGWSYAALTGAFSDGETFKPGGSIPPVTGGQPWTGTTFTSTQTGGPGVNPASSIRPGNTPPGKNPSGNNQAGTNPPGNKPPGNNPPGNNAPGNNPPGNPGPNPPANHSPTQNPPGGPTNGPEGPNDPPWNPTSPIPPISQDPLGDQLPVNTAPEPVSTVLVGTGLAALAAFRRRRRRD